MSNVKEVQINEDMFSLTIDGVLQEIEGLLMEEHKHLNEPKMKLLIKRMIGVSNYTQGKYIEEAEKSMEKLFYAWINLIVPLLKELERLQIPPISGINDEIGSFMRISNNYSYIANKEIEVLEKSVRFKLVKESETLNCLHMEFIENRQMLNLNGDEKSKYLKECLEYINTIKNKEIFKYQYPLQTMAASITKFGDFMTMLGQVGIYIFHIICVYANIVFLADEYLQFKSKLINEELNAIEVNIKDEELKNTKLQVYDYRGELEENFKVLNQQLDFYEITELDFKIIMVGFQQLDKLVQQIKSFENKYNCKLMDKQEFFRNLDIMAVKSMIKFLTSESEN